MRKIVGGTAGVLLGVLLATGPVAATTGSGTGWQASQADLQTAITVAKSYFEETLQTYSGLDPKTFAQYDKGLTAVVGSIASTAPQVISLRIADSGNSVILTSAPSKGAACWGIIDTTWSNVIDGFTGPGTIYVEVPKPGTRGCAAAILDRTTMLRGSYTSTTGFGGLPTP